MNEQFNVYLPSNLMVFFKEEAKRQKISFAHLVRQAIFKQYNLPIDGVRIYKQDGSWTNAKKAGLKIQRELRKIQ